MKRQPCFMMILTCTLAVGNPSALAEGQWHVERVDTGLRTGEGNAIAIDGGDNVHISYAASAGPDPGDGRVLKYAYFDGSWHIETVLDEYPFTLTSIAVDIDGNPHITYESWGAWVKYAYNDGSWHVETADSSGAGERNPRIVLDSTGQPRLTYADSSSSSVKYASRNGSWSVDTIPDSFWACPSLALDGSNKPHISFGQGNDDFHYAFHDGVSWHVELVEPGANPSFFSSIAVDSTGKPHVTYQHVVNSRLTYARRDTTWQIQTVSDDCQSTSLALDGNDAPHIAYCYDPDRFDDLSQLRYARYDGSWYVTTVDSGSQFAQDCSIALDSRGNPHISYTDGWPSAGCPGSWCVDLKHAWYSACRLSTSSQDCGVVVVGDWSESIFTVTNGGAEAMSGNVSESCDHYSIVSGGGPYNLNPDESVMVTVRFEPSSVGQHDCTIDTGSALCGSVSCTGTGELPDPACDVDPETLDYGTVVVGSHSDRTFVVTNTGGGTLSGSLSESCDDYSIISGAGAYDLGSGEWLVATVRYEPSSVGPHNCTIDTGSDLCSNMACTGEAQQDGIIPTVSEWGLVALVLLILTAATVLIGWQRRTVA